MNSLLTELMQYYCYPKCFVLFALHRYEDPARSGDSASQETADQPGHSTCQDDPEDR